MSFSPLVIKNNAEAILIQDNLSNLVCNSENYTLPTSITSGNFYVTIDSEIVDVTGISTDATGNYILYVDRAKEDTISVSHDAGTKVKLNILSKHITDITDTITDILNGDTTVGGLSSTGTISTISLNTSNLTVGSLSGILKATAGVVSGSATTANLPENTNLYYTNARARASISETITGIDYDSTTGVLSLTTGYAIPTSTKLSNYDTAYTLRVTTWGNGLAFSSNTAYVNYDTTNLKIVSGKLNTIQNIDASSSPTFAGLTLTDFSGVLKADSGSISSNTDTDDLPEGTTNKYFSNALARLSISETITGIDYNSTSGVLSLTSGYIIPTTTEQSNWDSAYTKRIDNWLTGLIYDSTNSTVIIDSDFIVLQAKASIYSGSVGLSYDFSSGAITVQSGYTIPSDSQISQWNVAYSNRVENWGYGLSVDYSTNTVSINYDASNLTISAYKLTTIQDIGVTSTPQFSGIFLNDLTGILKSTGAGVVDNPTTDDLTEGSTNKYFTSTLARNSISETITGIDYNSTTGVFSLTTGYIIPTTTNTTNWTTAYSLRVVTWGNGINFSDNTAYIDYNTTNLKITSNQIDTIQSIATSSSPTFAGLTLTGLSGVLKASTGVLSGSATTDDLTEGTTNKYFSNTLARNSISNTTTGLTYTSGTGVFSLTAGYVIPTTTEESNWNTAYSLRISTWGDGINVSDNTAYIDYNTTNLKITSNQIDTIQNISTTSSPTFAGLTLTDFSGMLKASTGSISGGANTDDLSEGSTNKYFSNTLARTAISNTITGITYTSSTGIFSLTAGYVIPTTTEETNWNSAYSERGSQIAGTGLTWDGTALNVDSTGGLVDTWRPITSTPVESDSTTSISSGWAYSHYTLNAAHGATGAVVGTTNSQILTNKTITSATIDGTSLVSGVFEGKISISDASNLIKIGTYAGKYTGASTNSIFIGGSSGPQTYSAAMNVSHTIGIGQNCLNVLDSSGSMTTAIGTYAGQTVVESISSCYFGYGAANGSTSSKYNIAIGTYALCPTTAYNSIALGYTANRYGNIIGRSVVIGYTAQLNQYNQSKDIYDNVIVGYLASQRNSGSRNVIIGSYAGQYAYASDSTNALATDNNIFIGYTAGRYETGSNKLIIGSTATYPIIYGDMSTGSLIFNKTLSLGYSGLYNGTLNILGDSTEGGKLRIYNSSASGSIVNNWRFDATGNLALIANYGATDNTVFYASPTYDVYFSHGIVVNTSSGTRPSYFSGDTQSYLLYVHTTNDMVGIGTNAPTELFTVNGNSAFNSVGKAGFASSTSYVDVTFDNEFNSVPIVVCTPEWSTSFYITAVSVTGFRINVGTPHGVTGTKYVHWHAFGEI